MNQAKNSIYLETSPEAASLPQQALTSGESGEQEERLFSGTSSVSAEFSLNPEIKRDLSSLTQLIANATEAYTAAIYLAESKTKTLILGGVHSLSRDFDTSASIEFGCGLIGWAAQSGERIVVCPFERDATTLLCYKRDQELKSFIAIPIIDRQGRSRGVLACDSKKNYAFAKVTEKILLGFTEQALNLLELHGKLLHKQNNTKALGNSLPQFLESIRKCGTEEQLLTSSAGIPSDIIERDALVVLVTSQGGVGRGVFYSASSPQNQTEHRLLELVCRHKKILCADRSVQALPRADASERSFLSVPFQVLGKEAGSLNLLSKPCQPFTAEQIASLEGIAKIVGKELEHTRLRDKYASNIETTGTLSWNSFSIRGNVILREASQTKVKFSLARISVENLSEIERLAGTQVALGVMQKIMRLVEQIKREPSASCYLYGCQILLLMEEAHIHRSMVRLRKLMGLVDVSEFSSTKTTLGKTKLGELLVEGTKVAFSEFPKNGQTISELASEAFLNLENQSKRGAGYVKIWGK